MHEKTNGSKRQDFHIMVTPAVLVLVDHSIPLPGGSNGNAWSKRDMGLRSFLLMDFMFFLRGRTSNTSVQHLRDSYIEQSLIFSSSFWVRSSKYLAMIDVGLPYAHHCCCSRPRPYGYGETHCTCRPVRPN